MTVSLSVFEVTVENGVTESFAVPVATLVTKPPSMSAWVIVYEAVQVMNAPGANAEGVCGHVTVALSSVTAYEAVEIDRPDVLEPVAVLDDGADRLYVAGVALLTRFSEPSPDSTFETVLLSTGVVSVEADKRATLSICVTPAGNRSLTVAVKLTVRDAAPTLANAQVTTPPDSPHESATRATDVIKCRRHRVGQYSRCRGHI